MQEVRVPSEAPGRVPQKHPWDATGVPGCKGAAGEGEEAREEGEPGEVEGRIVGGQEA